MNAPRASASAARAADPIRRRARRRAALLALLALLSAGPAATGGEGTTAPSGPLTLDQLMERMSSTSGVRAEFREERVLAVLDAPLVSEGMLYFIPPARMARITTRPGASKLVIDGGRLSYTDETGASDVDLGSNRVARTLVENFVVLFSGDLAALRARYEIEFGAEGLRWHLRLVPKAAPLANFIASVELRGDGPSLEEMSVRESDGDRTVTRFQRVETDTRFTPEELSRLFPTRPSAARP